MNAIVLTQEKFEELLSQLSEIKAEIKGNPKAAADEIIDNADFIQLMKISKRTAQSWRDEGKISFSQVGGKIYYKMSDVNGLLDNNHKPAFKKNSSTYGMACAGSVNL